MKNYNILKWALVIAIVIVLNLLFNVTVSLVYGQPQYDQFCKMEPVRVEPIDAKTCTDRGGQWNSFNYPVPVDQTMAVKPNGSCDLQFTCRQDFDKANTVYSRNSFVVLVVLGALAIIISFFVSGVSAVALGLALGGVLSLVIASIRYWSYMQEYWRFGVLAVALAALIWLGVKKIKE